MSSCENELYTSIAVGLAVFLLEQLLSATSCDSNSSSEFIMNLLTKK